MIVNSIRIFIVRYYQLTVTHISELITLEIYHISFKGNIGICYIFVAFEYFSRYYSFLPPNFFARSKNEPWE